jgi:hypothetical protein
MGIFDKLRGKDKSTEQEDPDLAQQQGGQQGGYEYSQDMGTAQSTIGQQPQGGYQDPNMSDQGYQDPNMQDPNTQDPSMQDPSMQDPSMQDPSMQDPNMQDPNMQDPSMQDPSMSDQGYQDPNEDPDMGEGEQKNRW